MWNDYEVHKNHCNMGDYEGTCKYSDPDCPIQFGIDLKKVKDGAEEIVNFVQAATNDQGVVDFVRTSLSELLSDIVNDYEKRILADRQKTLSSIIEQLVYTQNSINFEHASQLPKAAFDIPYGKLSPVHQKIAERQKLPPNMTPEIFFRRVYETCGCHGRHPACDCVSVVNKTAIEVWTEYNTGG